MRTTVVLSLRSRGEENPAPLEYRVSHCKRDYLHTGEVRISILRKPRRENIKNATYTAGSVDASFGAAALIAAIAPTSSARGFERFGISTRSFRKLVRSGRLRFS